MSKIRTCRALNSGVDNEAGQDINHDIPVLRKLCKQAGREFIAFEVRAISVATKRILRKSKIYWIYSTRVTFLFGTNGYRKLKIRQKFLVIFLLMTVIPMFIVGYLIFNSSKNILADRTHIEQTDILQQRTDFMQLMLEEYKQDVTLSSLYPPIQGAIRAQETGVDPIDDSTLDQWKLRLQSIFTSILITNPGYYQMRYIDEHGNEIVRVDARNGVIKPVPQSELQNKAQREYFQETTTLAEGQFYVSDIDLNIENGKIEIPHTPVLRVATPVFSAVDRAQKGIVILNIFEVRMLGNMNANNNGDTSILINQDGNYLYYADKKKLFGKQLGNGFNYFDEQPELAENLLMNDEKWIEDKEDNEFRIWKKIYYSPQNKSRYWVLISKIDTNLLFKPIIDLRNKTLLINAITIIVVLLIVIVVSRSITLPIIKLSTTASNIAKGDLNANFDKDVLEGDDEFSALATSFDSMTRQLISANIELEKKVQDRTLELEQSEAKTRTILDTVADAVIVINSSGIIQVFSRSAELLFGYEANEVIGKNINLLMPEPHKSRHDGYLQRYEQTKQENIIGTTRELEAKDKNGKVFPIDLSVKKANINGEILFTGLVRDTTERKKTEAIIANANKDLARSNKELEEFAYVASHDLKAPLRGIESLSNWMIEDYNDVLDDKGRKNMKLMSNRVKRMSELIDGILAYSRVGQVPEDAEEVNINNLVTEIVDLLSVSPNIKITIDTDLPAIFIEKTPIQQVFQNLISNAIKAMDKPEGEIHINCVAKNDYWVFSVSDNGKGIEAKYFDKIFQLFQSLEGGIDQGNTGVGLTVVKKIIELYSGSIWLESTVNQGTTFYFTLPQKPTGISARTVTA